MNGHGALDLLTIMKIQNITMVPVTQQNILFKGIMCEINYSVVSFPARQIQTL